MRRILPPIAAALAVISSATAAQVKIGSQTFTLPDGFVIEQVATAPQVSRPIEASFDEMGRLYVTDSSGSNAKLEEQLKGAPHRIVRLEDSDGNGSFDKSVVFVPDMMFPEGCQWLDGSLYVSAVPSIWKLTDTDGDGVADKREEWFKGGTLTRCGNDLHGPYLGPDGWLYWGKGGFALSNYERPGKAPIVSKASHIFRCRPDGSGLESVMAGGMDNPVGIAFTRTGERILSCTFFQHPGGGQRDGLIHAIYGGVYGKPHDVLDGLPRTGADLMPVLAQLGPAAPCGIHRCESDALGPRGGYFVCAFNTNRVVRTTIDSTQSPWIAKTEDFLVSDSTDFHPTDVLEDADGSLLVIDTGGWYKLCCPTSQLYKPDVLGAIYRIRKTDAKPVEDPRGLKIDWKSADVAPLVKLLGDARPAVRVRAIAVLSKLGAPAIPALAEVLRGQDSEDAQLGAVWSLTRIDAPGAREAVRGALAATSPDVRLAAASSISLWRDPAAGPALIEWLDPKKGEKFADFKRLAAEALGRMREAKAVRPIVEAITPTADRVLKHALIFALLEIGDRRGTASGLYTNDAAKIEAALLAMDQMGGEGLQPTQVLPWLDTANLATRFPGEKGAPSVAALSLRASARWIVGHHPDWDTQLVALLRPRLAANKLDADFSILLADLARSSVVQNLLAEAAMDAAMPEESRQAVLRAMASAPLKKLPEPWVMSLAVVLRTGTAELRPLAASVARAIPPSKEGADTLASALLAAGDDAANAPALRLAALAAIPQGNTVATPAAFDFLRSQLAAGVPTMTQSAAADALARLQLDRDQIRTLTTALDGVTAVALTRLLPLFESAADASLGAALLTALEKSPATTALPPAALRTCLAKFPADVQERGKVLLEKLGGDTASQKARLDSIAEKLMNGDIRRGQAVFNGPRAACSACHAIGYLGGNYGPDLTRIGEVRTERDLLEAVVFPSASFVRSYEPVLVVKKDRVEISGLLRKDNGDEVIVATGPGAELHIPRDEIAELRPGSVSPMPQGIDRILSTQELADLIAFLKATRW